jgi:two-component system, NarL family, nitrate/nitrite response regulator NarL
MKKIRVLIADDHQVLLDGLVMMLKGLKHIELVSTAANGEEVLKQMDTYAVDVLLMDIQMPVKDGFETAKIVKENHPETKVLILSMHSERVYIEKMYALGVHGYLLKTAGKAEIIKAIEKVYSGEKYYSKDITLAILNNSNANSKMVSDHLTKREKEVLLLIANGLTNIEMAERLFLSFDTIKTHRKNLMQKLDIKNTAGLVKYAMENLTSVGSS